MFLRKKQATEATTIKERFQDKSRWKKVGADLALAFMGGLLITTMISIFTPGYPIIVGTPSIQTGVYWLSKLDSNYRVDDLVTFPFKPTQQWIIDNHGQEKLVHTKMVLGVAGDIIYSDKDSNLKVCRKEYTSQKIKWCRPMGSPKKIDSKNRPLHAWLAPNSEYTLKTNELWVMGQHPKSLDSRYHGPISKSIVRGKAKLLLPYGEPPEHEIPLEEQKFTEIQN